MTSCRSIRILYIEDDAGLARLLQKTLQRRGYLVDLAHEGEKGLSILEKEAYDILLVDYNLPGMGGLDVIRILSVQGRLLPTIMVTAHGNEKVAVEAMKAGAADYIVKDVDLGYLELLPLIIEQLINKQELMKERQQVIEALHESEDRYRRLVELSLDGIAILIKRSFTFINPAGAKLLGASSPEELLGKPIHSFIHSDGQDSFLDRLKQIEDKNQLFSWVEEKFIRPDDRKIEVEVAGIPFIYQGQQAVQIIFRDITDHKLAKQKLEYLALYDSLTGLPNRMMFFDRLKQSAAQAKRYNHSLALLFLDLDHFKSINDNLGHHIGDLLLKETAQRLISSARDSDTIARMGGDEFTIILTKIEGEQDAALVGERILKALSCPFILEGHECQIGVSIGICLYPGHVDDIDTLLKKADNAMYKAKKKGKNTLQFYR